MVAADLKLSSDIRKQKKNKMVSSVEWIHCKTCMIG
jgi:hypothetical protein